jgi:hydrogenase maturation protease
MKRKRILVAGMGNVFMKDDGFGAEVIKRLLAERRHDGIEIKDFGTGCLKLAYDLMRGYDGLILVDASKRGGAPGTLYVIEPEPATLPPDLTQGGPIDPHWTDTETVLRFVKSLGAWPTTVRIIGCEPAAADLELGLSAPVQGAVEEAVKLVKFTIEQIQAAEGEKAYERDRHAA